MRWNIPLTSRQQELVENNLSLVYWVITESIHVNETIYGFGYEDLYQEGCIWLCHAAAPMTPHVPGFLPMPKKLCAMAFSPIAGKCAPYSAGLLT